MEIINCTWESKFAGKFKFQCPRHWNGLRQTSDPNVRACDSCLENVYLCQNEAEAAQRAKQGQCVALGFLRHDETMLLGELMPENETGT